MAGVSFEPPLQVTVDQSGALKRLVVGQKVERRLYQRAAIIWRLAEGHSVREVADHHRVTSKTVRKWARRFQAEGMNGLYDRPRSGRPPVFSAERRCELIAMACARPDTYGLTGEPRWTVSTLTRSANRAVNGLQMSRTSVWRTLHRNALKPHRQVMWLHSPDPQFKEKVNAIVALYRIPLDDAVVLCVDEKPGIQAVERKHPTRLPIPGRLGRYEYEYIRHGTQTLLSAFDVRTGEVTAACGESRKAEDVEAFMERLAERYAHAERVIVIWDNLNIHHEGRAKRWSRFNARHGNKFTFIYTPLHASWVNQVEIFFSILHRRVLKHGNFTSQADLRAKLLAFIQRWNHGEGHAFNWTFRGYPMQAERAA